MPGRYTTERDRRVITKLAERGFTANEIADVLGVHPSTVRLHVPAEAVLAKRPVDRRAVQKLAKLGLTQHQIADALRVTRYTVMESMKQMGISPGSGSYRNRPDIGATDVAAAVARGVRVRHLAATYDCTTRLIYARLREAGVAPLAES